MGVDRCRDCKLAIPFKKGEVHTLQSVGLGAMKVNDTPEVDRTCLNFFDVVIHQIPQTIEEGADDACVKKGSFVKKD